jgi:hypothetical protein
MPLFMRRALHSLASVMADIQIEGNIRECCGAGSKSGVQILGGGG